jgi:glycosyltransferase involved in cell wall biosynthesis
MEMNNLKVVSLSNLGNNHYRNLLVKHLNYKGVQIIDYFPNLIFLPRIIWEGKPDILHIHMLHYFLFKRNNITRLIKFLLFITQVFILRLIGTKTVITVHEWADRLGDGKHDIPLQWAAILGRLFHALITHCESTRNEIIKAFRLENKNKVFVIPHGNYIGSYENKVSQLEARKFLGINTEDLVFLLFGNIHRTKGFLEAIDVFKRLQQTKIFLLIAGYPGEEEIEELIKDKVKENENILFVPGIVPDEEVQIYMNASDCVIVPYKVFTTSGVTILAMSFGRACIAPQVGFFRDMLDDCGAFLYDSTHEDNLLQAMKGAIEKRASILDMGKHNFKIAEEWSWDYVAEETLNIYKKCLIQW